MTDQGDTNEHKSYRYEFFILAISLLAIINILIILLINVPEMDQVLRIINFVLSLILLFDFLYRLLSAKSKTSYFFQQFGWIDLLGSIPLYWLPIFRLLRILRIIRVFRQAGAFSIIRDFRRNPAASLLVLVSFLVILVLQFGSFLVIGAESLSPNANITAPMDALWWALVTVTTVGYGDKYPVTNLGRLIGSLTIIVGVIMFSILTSFFTSKFSDRGQAESQQLIANAETDIQKLHSVLEKQSNTLKELQERLKRIEEKIDNPNE